MPHIILTLLLILTVSASAAQPEIPTQRVADLAKTIAQQPRGFGPTCTNRVAWKTPTIVDRTAQVRQSAEQLLKQDFPAWSQDLYRDYARTGTRPNGEKMMNDRKAWLYPLVIAECVEGQGRFMPAIELTITELINQPTWTWPAHNKPQTRQLNGHDDVDLLAADIALELAQALYLLGDWLPTPLHQRTLSALEQRIFDPLRKSFLGKSKSNYWLRTTNNWNAVCLAGVVGAALTILPKPNDRALFAAAGAHYIQNYLEGFTPDGYTSEGPGYWNYGFSHFVVLRHILLQATGGSLDLFADAKVTQMALYGYRIEMLPNNIAAFGDASPKTKMDDFARAYTNDALDLGQAQHLSLLSINKSPPGNDAPLTKAVVTLFANPLPASTHTPKKAPSIGLHSYFESVGVLVSRPAPGGQLAVSIKAGGNLSHSHNDIGSYTIALGAEQPTGDVGKTQYSAKTFSKERTTIPSISSWGHPVPVVAGVLQNDASTIRPRVVATHLTDASSDITINMADAYTTPILRTLTRTLKHQRTPTGFVSITDRFEYKQPAAFEVAVTTVGHWQHNPDGSITLWEKNNRLNARIEASGAWTVTAQESNEEGRRFTRIAIALKKPEKSGYITVRFEPSKP